MAARNFLGVLMGICLLPAIAHSRPGNPLTLSPQCRQTYTRYLESSLRGWQRMRGPHGLIQDTVRLSPRPGKPTRIVPYKRESAPTDIALDLLIQVELLGPNHRRASARTTLERLLRVLGDLPFHRDTGLFYRLYLGRKPTVLDLSSVDNFHLALALWTVARDPVVRRKAPVAARTADRLFRRMDLSPFFDLSQHLVAGNLRHLPAPERWVREPYRYHFGSEARSLYTAAPVLGLFRDPRITSDRIGRSLREVPLKLSPEGRLLVWDGGIFQSLLPTLLLGEEHYWEPLRNNLRELAHLVFDHPIAAVSEAGRALRVPRGATASLVGTDPSGQWLYYSGKVGLREIQDPDNGDSVDEQAVVPHALLLAAMGDPCRHVGALAALETVSAEGVSFFDPARGWTASAVLRPEPNGKRLQLMPVPGLVGVDKGIEILALLRILSPDALSPSARRLREQAPLDSTYRELASRPSIAGVAKQRHHADFPSIPLLPESCRRD